MKKDCPEQLDGQTQHETPSEYIIKLMEIILNQNIFTFLDSLWKQEVGAAMGSKPFPHYANVFLVRRTDKGIKKLALKYNHKNKEALQLLKRFWMITFLFSVEQQRNSTNY